MNKHVLVVGCAHGIGKATAERFLADGHQITGIDKDAGSITHNNYHHIQVDLSKPSEVEQVAEALTKQDITDVVYCAAEQHIFPATDFDSELAQRMITVNVLSAWQLIAHLQRAHIANSSKLESVVLFRRCMLLPPLNQ